MHLSGHYAVELRAACPGLAVVALSQYVEQSYAGDLLDSGDGHRVGYLLKDRVADVEDFAATLLTAAASLTLHPGPWGYLDTELQLRWGHRCLICGRGNPRMAR